MTRGLRCLLHGNVEAAFLLNPLGFVLFLGITIYLLYCVLVVTAKLPRLRWEALPKGGAIYLRISFFLLIVANWIYLILKEKLASI